MKKTKLKKAAAFFLTLTMMSGLFAGCGNTDTGNSQENEQTSSDAASEAQEDQMSADTGWEEVSAKVDIPEIIKKDREHMSWMDTTSPVTLTIYYPFLTGDFTEWGSTSVIEQKITELTGVTVDGSFAADSDLNELTLMIASGDKLPDIINGIFLNTTQYNDLVSSGSLYDLRELIDQYCPELWEDMDPYIRDANLDEDGHMYYMPALGGSGTTESFMISNGWFAVRGDVCEYFGIDPASITTLEDVEELLALYTENKELWPEIKYPYWFPALTSDLSNGRPFYNCYGGYLNYSQGSIDMMYDKDEDSVHYWMEDDYGYDALKYMWSLAQMGYVTEESFSIDDLYGELEAGSVLIASGTNMWEAAYANEALANNVEGAYYERISLPSADESIDARFSFSAYAKNCGRGVVIPKDCSDPERAIKFLQFLNSEYANLLVTSGIYGEDWIVDEENSGDLTVMKYIGDSETAEGRAERGVYNWQQDWYNTDTAYDYFNAYSTGEEIMRTIPETDCIYNAYAAAPVDVLANEPSDSDYSLLQDRIEEIMRNYQTQMILAPNEAAFDSLYEECLEVINQNGLDDLKEYVLGLTKEYIAEMEAVGVEFK